MTERRLLANIWRTPSGTILQSKHRYDFVQDSTGNYIDGGLEGYIRFGGADIGNWENLCVYSDDAHEDKRKAFYWGSRRGGDTEWILLKDLGTDHIEAILDTQWHIPEHIRDMFVDEVEFRKGFDS